MTQNNTISSLLNKFAPAPAVATIGDLEAEIRMLAQVIIMSKSGLAGNLANADSFQIPEVEAALTLVNEHMDELTNDNLVQVRDGLKKIADDLEKEVAMNLIGKIKVNPTASITELAAPEAEESDEYNDDWSDEYGDAWSDEDPEEEDPEEPEEPEEPHKSGIQVVTINGIDDLIKALSGNDKVKEAIKNVDFTKLAEAFNL